MMKTQADQWRKTLRSWCSIGCLALHQLLIDSPWFKTHGPWSALEIRCWYNHTTGPPGLPTQIPDTYTIQHSSIIISKNLQKDDENPGNSVKEDLALLIFNWVIGSSSTTDWFTRIQNSWPTDCSGAPLLLIQPPYRAYWPNYPTHIRFSVVQS